MAMVMQRVKRMTTIAAKQTMETKTNSIRKTAMVVVKSAWSSTRKRGMYFQEFRKLLESRWSYSMGENPLGSRWAGSRK